jgi:hypothetical protein
MSKPVGQIGQVDQHDARTSPERATNYATTSHTAEEHPRGTLVLMLLFIVVIIVLWVSMYLMLMGRG